MFGMRQRREKVPTEKELREMERKTFDDINAQRKKNNLNILTWDTQVADAARSHSQNMAARNFFSHRDPRLGELDERLKRMKIQWRMCGENIFYEKGYANPVQVAVEGWMDSPGHKKNVLTPEFTHSGVGIVRRSDGTFYFTQIFIRVDK
jgi:uncharacterized protein YkwD